MISLSDLHQSLQVACHWCCHAMKPYVCNNVTLVSGYGVRSPTDCWLSAWLVAIQSIWAAILNAITLGIIFARISQPKQRARTIFISDSAVVARRDGMLKFMFRVADIRTTQVSPACCDPPWTCVSTSVQDPNEMI